MVSYYAIEENGVNLSTEKKCSQKHEYLCAQQKFQYKKWRIILFHVMS